MNRLPVRGIFLTRVFALKNARFCAQKRAQTRAFLRAKIRASREFFSRPRIFVKNEGHFWPGRSSSGRATFFSN